MTKERRECIKNYTLRGSKTKKRTERKGKVEKIKERMTRRRISGLREKP